MKYILLDCSSIITPYKFTIRNKEDLSSIVGSFLKKLIKFSAKFDSNHFVFCWEGGGQCYRKALCPTYKGNRDEKKAERTQDQIEFDKEFYKQMNVIRDLVEGIGFNNSFSQKGCEADDILAKIPEQEESVFHDFVIVSTDKDLYQILKNPATIIYNQSEDKVLTKKWFVEKYNIEPDIFYKAKALAGDTGDNVIGIDGIGMAKAVSYLNGTMKETSKAYGSIMAFTKERKVENSRLVKLPIPQTKKVVLKKDDVSFERFLKWCMDYGLGDLLNEVYEPMEKFLGLESEEMMRKRRREERKKK